MQFLYVNYFNLWQASYWNNKAKLLNDYGFELWDRGLMAILVTHKACTEAWAGMQHFYDDEFKDHVNGLVERERIKHRDGTVVIASDSGADAA